MNGMMSRFRPVLCSWAALLAADVSAVAAPDWTKVKAGMNGDEAVKLLGQPLLRTAARGFDVWIYDGRGEMIFSGGPLKAWTMGAPTAESLARPVTQDVMFRASHRSVRRLPPTPSLPAPIRTYQEISTTRFRFLAQ